MKTLLLMAGTLALAAALGPAPALADPPAATATVDIMLTILPYAKVTLDDTSVKIEFPAHATSFGPIYIGGTVVCNVTTTLLTNITKPSGAPGDWHSYPVSESKDPGEGYDLELLRISIWNIPDDPVGWTGTLKVTGKSGVGPETPPAGEVIMTVVPGTE